MSETAPLRRILVACFGNPDRGDDGIGALVAQELEKRLPAGAELHVWSGDVLSLIGGCAGYGALICVDAAASMGAPGRIHRIEKEQLARELLSTSTHGFGVADAVALVRTLQNTPEDIVIYAIEGVCFEAGSAMTPAVAAAASEAATLIAIEARELQERGGGQLRL